jgi:hypothetical protein
MLMDTLHVVKIPYFMYFLLCALLLLSIWFVHTYFFDPSVSPAEIQMKKGSLIWRQLHYRLALFVIAIIAYGLTETTFNLWGYIQIQNLFGSHVADVTTPFFWMALILGQILLLVPLYFLPARKVFYCLILVIMGSTFFFPVQEKIPGMIFWLGVAGFGCSAVFPILLSQMEKEMLPFAKGAKIYPYIEKSISLMLAGYFVGVGLIDLWVQYLGEQVSQFTRFHFHLAGFFIACTGVIALFLYHTIPHFKHRA